MLVRVPGFVGLSSIYRFCKSECTLDNAIQRNHNTILWKQEECKLYYDGKEHISTEEDEKALLKFSDGDVILTNHKNWFRVFEENAYENTLFITSKCNSNCVMCPEAEASRKMEGPDISLLLEEVRYIPDETKFLTLTGGEPCLIGENFITVLEEIRRLCPTIFIQLLTNGRILSNRKYERKVAKLLGPFSQVGIPLYSPFPEMHDKITNAKGSFYQTVRGIKNLLSDGIKVELRIVVSKLNHEILRELGDYICEEFPSLFYVRFMALEMLGNAAVNEERVWIPYDLAFDSARDAIRKIVLSGIDVSLFNFPLCFVDKGYWTLCEKSISKEKVVFSEECDICSMKEICGGMFKGTERFLKGKVKPIND